MALALYYHPFSSYCWKVLIPLYEAGTAFSLRRVDDPEAGAEFKRRWPVGRFPLLVDEARDITLPETTIIIEYLDTYYPGARAMLPADPQLRLEVRLLDRIFDNYVHGSLQRIVGDRLRAADKHDPQGVADARTMLDTCYAWLNERMKGKEWAVGNDFSLADCAAAPALFYSDWVHPIGDAHPNVSAYRARLLERPSVKRAVDEARPFRSFFPGGAPDRD
jgi:glutathione S-transferase